jgi:hypothetical protein
LTVGAAAVVETSQRDRDVKRERQVAAAVEADDYPNAPRILRCFTAAHVACQDTRRLRGAQNNTDAGSQARP